MTKNAHPLEKVKCTERYAVTINFLKIRGSTGKWI